MTQQTAIQQMIDFINDINDNDRSEFNYYYDSIIGKLNELLEVEKQQLENARPQITSSCVIKEISDDEIEKAANEHLIFWRGKNHHLTNPIHADRTINDFKAAIKWYREQLKKK